MLAGCGGSQPSIGTPGSMPRTSAGAVHEGSGGSWIQPDAKKGTFATISPSLGGVNIYSYPADKLVGQLAGGFGSPEGLCNDKAGNVFVTDTSTGDVYEYAHGATQRLATLYDNSAPLYPFGCSVDPTTNNLAVTSADTNDIFVFKK